jgi:hypothetical protein
MPEKEICLAESNSPFAKLRMTGLATIFHIL